jgi:hypothetical protein
MGPEGKLAVIETALEIYESSMAREENQATEKKLEIATVAIQTIQATVELPSF